MDLQKNPNPKQDEIVAELTEKLRSSEMRQKEMEATLTDNKIKESLAEYQTETGKLLTTRKENVRRNH